MRHFSFVLLSVCLFSTFAAAQTAPSHKTGNDRFSFRVQPAVGMYMDPSSNLLDLDPNAPTALNFGIEFPSSRQRPWQQYLNDPTVGLGVSYLNLGTDAMGEGIAMYPYIMINAFRREHFEAKARIYVETYQGSSANGSSLNLESQITVRKNQISSQSLPRV